MQIGHTTFSTLCQSQEARSLLVIRRKMSKDTMQIDLRTGLMYDVQCTLLSSGSCIAGRLFVFRIYIFVGIFTGTDSFLRKYGVTNKKEVIFRDGSSASCHFVNCSHERAQ